MFNTIWGYIAWAVLTAVLTVAATEIWHRIRGKKEDDEE